MSTKLIPNKDTLLQQAGVLHTATTLRTWKSKGKYPEIFRKIGGRLYIDLEAYQRHVLEMNPSELNK
ncbi:hypothetical protein FHQ18_00385 [Deferribacter autotrophicus]|uniref:Uncharacterized protein n=1 Tax=Deferribacter autotrophicus TaxID=500465 RepID=A0A5A8F824_9BACT|nr:hypothetical protein [Deferribacter autotrophicus]KAA0259368.1 hypothetical protein FHQ18_00385 [Deferribacter autotrophicus]